MTDANFDSDKIIKSAKNTLCGEVHALFRAIASFPHKECESDSPFTDGVYFNYNADDIKKRCETDENAVNRLILHSLFHCVFLHIFNTDFKNRALWDLSCDICVEKMINDSDILCAKTDKAERQIFLTKKLAEKIKHFTAENLYFYFSSEKAEQNELLVYTEAFCDDCHDIWYKLNFSGTSPYEEDLEEVEARSIYKFADDSIGDYQDGENKNNDDNPNSPATKSEEWRETAKRIIRDSQNEQGLFDSSRGMDTDILKSVTRDKYDYSEFLKKFIQTSEQLEINDDEFDYIYYTYGMKLYGNIPLIEPLEYAENANIKKLIIAIDTSGSVLGEPVERFIEKTYNILKTTDFFKKETEIHIIQCDADIQSIDIIKNENELEKYMKNIVLKGFGGTDFRPVFDYADKLKKLSPNSEVNGVIYFTDGDGKYPKSPPNYKNVFIIYDNGFDETKMPKWAIPLYMDRDELLKKC